MILIFAGLLDPGDEVLLTDPHYACYPNFLRLVDAVPRYVPVREEDGFQLRPEELGPYLTPRTKAMHHQLPGQPHGHPDRRRSAWPAWRSWVPTSFPTRSTTAWFMKARSTASWSSPTGPW